jgi:hypothetical protein
VPLPLLAQFQPCGSALVMLVNTVVAAVEDIADGRDAYVVGTVPQGLPY